MLSTTKWHISQIAGLFGYLGMVVMVKKTQFDASANWSILLQHSFSNFFIPNASHHIFLAPSLTKSTPRAPIGPADTILSFQCFLSLGEPILPIIPGLGGGAARISLDCSSSKIYWDILSLIQSCFLFCLALGLGPRRCHLKSRKYSVSLVEWLCWSLTT